jgi:hypothetical protein
MLTVADSSPVPLPRSWNAWWNIHGKPDKISARMPDQMLAVK